MCRGSFLARDSQTITANLDTVEYEFAPLFGEGEPCQMGGIVGGDMAVRTAQGGAGHEAKSPTQSGARYFPCTDDDSSDGQTVMSTSRSVSFGEVRVLEHDMTDEFVAKFSPGLSSRSHPSSTSTS